MKQTLLSLLVVAALAGGAYLAYSALRPAESGGGQRGGGPTPVRVADVSAHAFVDALEVVGTAQANESVTVVAKVTERVAAVHFREGTTVEAGALLVELDKTEVEAQLAEARAAAREARKQYERREALTATQAISASALDEQAGLLEAAEARVKAIEARLADHEIRAPFAGRLGLRRVSTGALLQPGDVITTLDDLSTIKLDFPVPETFLAGLREGLPVTAHSVAWPEVPFTGTIDTIDSRVDPVTRAVLVRALVDNTDDLLKPGMLLTIDLRKNERTSLGIPEQALIPVEGRQYVFVVEDDQTVSRREVRIDGREPGVVEVVSGLEAGETIVTEGGIRLQPGASVAVIDDRANPEERT